MNIRLLCLILLLGAVSVFSVEAKLPVPRLPDIGTVPADKVEAALASGVEFLLKNQNADGSWGNYTHSLSDSVLCPAPNGPRSFRIGTTALDIMALLRVAPEDPGVKKAVNRASDWLLKELPRLRRPDVTVLYNVWAHCYSLQALAALARFHHDSPELVARYRTAAGQQLKQLDLYANMKGGWGYYEFSGMTARPSFSSMSFTTAAILIAMRDAEREFGLKLNEPVCGRAVRLLQRLRTPEGTFIYGDHLKGLAEAMPTSRHMGSLGRTVICNLALSLYGDTRANEGERENALDWMWARNGWLLIAKKWPIPHESYAKNAGYFVFFGYYYAGLTLESLPAERRSRHASLLAGILLPQQEPQGCWWDFPMMDYHRQYGTGFALLALESAKRHLAPGA